MAKSELMGALEQIAREKNIPVEEILSMIEGAVVSSLRKHVGKNADIVLLSGNPVESVQNLHKISGVVRAGFYYSQADLDALRARAKEPRARPGP